VIEARFFLLVLKKSVTDTRIFLGIEQRHPNLSRKKFEILATLLPYFGYLFYNKVMRLGVFVNNNFY
jgi:hypothetical protein